MALLNISLLGDFEVRLGSGPPLRLRARKSQALLAYLSFPVGRSHSREKLATLLWGDQAPSQARTRLRETLFAVRKAAARAEAGWLLTEGDSVALRSETVRVDAVAFEDLVRKGSPDALEAAVALYRGDFLHGFTGQTTGFEEWLLAERERLRELAIHTLAHLLTRERTAGHLEAALPIALRLATLDPLQEPVHRTLMRLYAQLGRRGAALRQYQTCCALLRRELRVGPEAETKQLYQDLLRRRPLEGIVAGPAPRRSLPRPEAALTGWPGKDIPVIGRAGELTRLDEAFTMASEAGATW